MRNFLDPCVEPNEVTGSITMMSSLVLIVLMSISL